MYGFFTACTGVILLVLSGGSEAARQEAGSEGEFPYQVLISQTNGSPKCGGVLVDDSFIITSATCVFEFGGIKRFLEKAVVYGGGTHLLYELGDVSEAVVHPQYTVNPVTFDVAVVKFVPGQRGPHVNATVFNGAWSGQGACNLTSWWSSSNSNPTHLMWEVVSAVQCTPPDHDLLCFADNVTFIKRDYGSPIVCGGVLTGLVPQGGGNKAINLTSHFEWITETISELKKSAPSMTNTDRETTLYLLKILQRLDELTHEKSDSQVFGDQFNSWNNQIVVPLSYILFAMVIFFFVLLFFIVLFTVVLVYYSRK